jgi:hypothetical protein
MATITNTVSALQRLFTTDASRCAKESGVIRRNRVFTPETLAKTFVLTWLGKPMATLDELAQAAGSCGAVVSAQAIDQRFTPSLTDFFRRLLASAVSTVVSGNRVDTELMKRFAGIYLLDSSIVALPDEFQAKYPGCGGGKPGQTSSQLKLEFRFNISNGDLLGPIISTAPGGDYHTAVQQAPLPKGSLRVADLGFFSIQHLQEFSAQGVFWLTRLLRNTTIYQADGAPIGMTPWLRKQTHDSIDLPIQLGNRQRLPCRLIVIRVPTQVVRKRRKKLRQAARRINQVVTRDQLEWSRWTLMVTNVPQEKLSVDDAIALGRTRWQIELLIKLFKQNTQLGVSRSSKPERILCEIFAKLIGQVVQHWLLLTTGWNAGNRSLVRATKAIHHHAFSIATGLHQTAFIRKIIRAIRKALTKASRLDQRKQQPNHRQILENPKIARPLT